MAKKRSWFSLVKRLFSLDAWYKHEKEKRRKRGYRVKVRSRLPAVEAQLPQPERREREESEEEKRKRALDVAIASAAAAQAAIEAAQVAAEVVLLASVPKLDHQWGKEEDKSVVNVQYNLPHFTRQCGKEIHEVAAIRIQSTFRGYLARKALHALKGIVKLQAIIRGRNVRRQAMTTLKCLQSLVSIQSKVQAKRVQMVEEPCDCNDNKQLQSSLDEKIVKMETNKQRRWNGSILTKEEANASFMSKKEAALRRERIREYAYNHRNSAETERYKVNERLRYWMDTQLNKSKELEDLDSVVTSNPKPKVHYRGKQLKQRGTRITYQSDGFDSPITRPTRPIHRKQCSLGEDNSFPYSPVVPTYMAATESAKAKRSLSSPKLRPGSFDAYSDSYSPCKNKLSLSTSTASEVPSRVRFGNCNAHQQRSPSLKGLTGPVKSSRTLLNDLSFDSDYSFRTCQLQNAFK